MARRLGAAAIHPVSSCPAPVPASDETACVQPVAPAVQRDRLAALIALLGDESPLVWEHVHRELVTGGRRAESALRRASSSHDARARGRARSLLAEIARQRVVRRLVRYALRESVELEPALLLLARLGAPEFDARPVQRLLDSYAAELLERSRHVASELERVRLIPRYLHGELGFGGSIGAYQDPANIHLHRVLERRAGMPLSLCALYLFVARRMGVRAAIVPLPGHVMLRLYADGKSLIIDPYHQGSERTERECRRYLEQNGMGFSALYLRDAGDRAMFKRQVLNLMRSAEKRGLKREAQELGLVVRALDPRTAAALAERGPGSSRGGPSRGRRT